MSISNFSSQLLVMVACTLSFAEVLIPASDPNINYFGRFDLSTPSKAKFNWSGCIIEASFPGPSIAISLTDGQADYDVEIDGVVTMVIRSTSATTRYPVSTALSSGSHTIRLMQRSENHWNTALFGGFYLADGKALLPAPPKPARKIEFIGDSHTAGYGNESTSRTCSSIRTYTNANKSFGALVTRAFRAQSIVLGYSGAGMVRNFNDTTKKSDKPFPYYYGTTFGDAGGSWDFASWIPDLVVICLGTNDFSTTPYPDDTMYANGYHHFITRVRSNYPAAPIVCVATHTGPMDNQLKQIVAAETTSLAHKNVFYAEYPQTLALTGCDWHPSLADDQAIANALIASIMKNVGWDTGTVMAVASPTPAPRQRPRIFVREHPGGFLISSSTGTGPGTSVTVTDLHGRRMIQGNLDRQRSFLWNASATPPGCYLISVQGTGMAMRIMKK